jgi:polyisoprenoid-binding protein YceI
MATLTIDPDHSVAAFAVRHMTVALVRGIFGKVTGTIDFDREDIARCSVEVAIEAASLSTGIKKRDGHLLSEDFFHAEKHPSITFRSTKIEPLGENRARVTGDLTIRGVTRSITGEAELSGPATSFDGDTSMGFAGRAAINREDFGVSWNAPMRGEGVMVGREVELTLDIEADVPKD